MLVTLLGSPCSGKTTVAAMVFSALKDAGVPAEFIPETARLFIAERRAVMEKPFHLTDLDQILIMRKQLEVESMMIQACGKEVVVVADGSPLNSLLYMKPETRQEYSVRAAIQQHRLNMPLAFYVHTVSPGFGSDPNRIHDMETSRAIDAFLPELMSQEVEWLKYIPLVGNSRHRTDSALSYIFTQLLQP